MQGRGFQDLPGGSDLLALSGPPRGLADPAAGHGAAKERCAIGTPFAAGFGGYPDISIGIPYCPSVRTASWTRHVNVALIARDKWFLSDAEFSTFIR